jgi:hypothetical protein
MQALIDTIRPNILEETQLVSKMAGFAYVGDYLEMVLDRENLITKAEAELKLELQKGIDSGYVVADEVFFSDWKKRLGVQQSYAD